jgi:hypothetical protein
MRNILATVTNAFARHFGFRTEPVAVPRDQEHRSVSTKEATPLRPPLSAIERPQGNLLCETAEPPHGRIKPEVLDLLAHNIRIIKEQILPSLPATMDAGTRDYTYYELLKCSFQDWTENANTLGLGKQDVRDLHSFIVVALSLSKYDVDRSPDASILYRVILKTLLIDWLENWNADAPCGPPER